MVENKQNDLNKKARNAMFLVAVLNILTALLFWFGYMHASDEQKIYFLIVVIVTLISSVVIVILAQTLMKK